MNDREMQIVPQSGTEDLFLPPPVRNIINAVVRFEKTRACVFGSWANTDTAAGTQPASVQAHAHAHALTDSAQKACIVGLAGPAGAHVNCTVVDDERRDAACVDGL
jgi:hypothetical protein